MPARSRSSQVSNNIQAREDEVAIRFREAVRAGQDWFDALLDAIAAWHAVREVCDGREYRYLIGGEAFDWLLLAERLILGADGLIPQAESEALLFHGRLPRPVMPGEFRKRLGGIKHHAVANYWYGVLVEEALILASEHEVRKARRAMSRPEDLHLDDVVYERIYGKTRQELWKEFHAERKQQPSRRASLSDLREFTYWLFKYRVKHAEPARLASDTRKGLAFLRSLGRGDADGWP